MQKKNIRQAHQGKKKAQYTENKNPRILKKRKEKKKISTRLKLEATDSQTETHGFSTKFYKLNTYTHYPLPNS